MSATFAAALPNSAKRSHRNELDFTKLLLLDQLAELRTLETVFGGDLLRRNFGCARKKGVVLTVFTNATLVDEEVAKRFEAFPLKEVSTSLYGTELILTIE